MISKPGVDKSRVSYVASAITVSLAEVFHICTVKVFLKYFLAIDNTNPIDSVMMLYMYEYYKTIYRDPSLISII